MSSDNLPHMLFYGPPGTGKTSTILALAREMYGPELMKTRVLELNASDERGISIVREKVKDFARLVVSTPSAESQAKYPCPPFKLIVLDEADSMTSDAQSALRRTMENYSKVTRFCLICNFVTRIIDPLASRCSKFRFKPLNETNALERVHYICREENVNVQQEVLLKLLKCAGGDLRRAITLLQSASRAVTEITLDFVADISATIPDDAINELVRSLKEGNLAQIKDCAHSFVLQGYSGSQVAFQLHESLLTDELISTLQKNSISWVLSETDKRLSDGADEQLELLSLMITLAAILQGEACSFGRYIATANYR